MSSCQQSVIVGLLHDEPHVVHCLELLYFSLFVTDGRSEVPFPQILKHRETERWLCSERWLEAEQFWYESPPSANGERLWKEQRWWKVYLRLHLMFISVNIFLFA